ncbi:MAG: hypothetical protein ABL999_01280 [Pyrinomonadaceae bacterium]
MRNSGQKVLVGVSLLLLVVNVFLLYQYRIVKRELELSKLTATDIGFKFPVIAGNSISGIEESYSLEDSQKKTLLLVFSPYCEYCQQQYPTWRRTIEQLDPSRWRVLGLTGEKDPAIVEKHLEQMNIGNIKVLLISPNDLRKTRLLYTPMTIVVNTAGQAENVWPGLWLNEDKSVLQ